MNVVMLSKALISCAYRRKCELLARQVDALSVFVPPYWGPTLFEPSTEQGYDLRVLPLRLNGNFHLHHYPTLRREMNRVAGASKAATMVHIDEEPYNLATFLALREAQRAGARSVFFSWQNLLRRYPPPFSWMEQYAFRAASAAIVGNAEAASVLRAKGFRRAAHVIPQFGVDENVFAPAPVPKFVDEFVIGYAGRLVREKGVDLLLRALAAVPQARVRILGDGDQKAQLQALVQQIGLVERVEFVGAVASNEMPTFYRSLDCLVLPSRALPNWKEQFGRVLIEAMACGVPVIGAQSGEIPNVIGDAGLLFEEENVDALRTQIEAFAQSANMRARLAEAGRKRVLGHFTMQRVVDQTINVYREIMHNSR